MKKLSVILFALGLCGLLRAQDARVDLSASGTANCYIVPAAGEYSFLAAKALDNKAIAGAEEASLLWQATAGGTDVDILRDLRLSDGRICFNVPEFVPANLLVAALDSRGNILWSWHLWLTASPDQQSESGTPMDRNLGALSVRFGDPAAAGLSYQWGRKDPLLPGSYIVTAGRVGAPEQYATAQPVSFIPGDDRYRDWMPRASSGEPLWSDERKTAADPCPAGWRVPRSDWWKSNAALRVYGSDLTGIIALSEPGAVERINDGEIPLWYPSAGYIDWRSGEYLSAGVYGFYWTSGTEGELADQMYFFRTGYLNALRATFRAYGCSVRCVRE